MLSQSPLKLFYIKSSVLNCSVKGFSSLIMLLLRSASAGLRKSWHLPIFCNNRLFSAEKKADDIAKAESDTVHFAKSLIMTEQKKDTNKEIYDISHLMPHPIWKEEQLQKVGITHLPPKGMIDGAAYCSVKGLRFTFDILSGNGLFKEI